MIAPIVTFDGLTDRDLVGLRASTVDQLQTATAEWERVVSGDDRPEATMPLVETIHAAERRLDRINAELARRQRKAAA
jgi:hypothetical protein